LTNKHAEAVTSRPLALHGIARRTHHSNQTTVEITSTHSKADLIAKALVKVSTFLNELNICGAVDPPWRLILSAAFQSFLCGKVLGWTGRLAETYRVTTVFT
jgi:hypothetical protein